MWKWHFCIQAEIKYSSQINYSLVHISSGGSSDSSLLWMSCCSSCRPPSLVCESPPHGWPWWLCSWHGWSSGRRGTAALHPRLSGFSRCKLPLVFGIRGLQKAEIRTLILCWTYLSLPQPKWIKFQGGGWVLALGDVLTCNQKKYFADLWCSKWAFGSDLAI